MLEAILQMVMGLEEDTTSTNGATTNSIKNENGVVHAGAVDPEEAAYAVSHLLLPSEASANDSIGIENRSKVDEYIAEPRNESSQLDASAILLGEEHTTSLASVAAHQLFVTDLTEHIEPKHEQQTAVTDHVHAGPPPLDADLGAGDTEVVNNVAAAMFTTPHPPSTQLPVMMSVATTFVGDRTPFVAPPMTMPVVYLTNGAATTVNSSLSYNCPEAEVSITQDTDGRGHLQNRNENPNQTEDKKRLSSITNTTCSATKRRRYSSSTRKSLPRWNDMLFQIILYRIDHGHCMVPFKTGGELGKWVAIQRAQYAKLQQHTMADPASMVAADSPSGGIGDVQSKDIEEAIDSTTCNDGMQVDSTDNNTHLAARDTGAIEVQDSAESLNIERANVLSSLGFVWDVIQADNDARWKKRFEELVKYKAVHGHCNVPQSTELGKWVKMQRENKHETDLKKSGKTPIRKKPKPCLSDKRIAKLESLGFQWRVAKPAVGWERRFEQLLDYKVKHGDCNVPQSYPLDKPFGRWVMKQRCQQSLKLRGEKSQLTNERERKLTELGFSWVAPGFSKKSLGASVVHRLLFMRLKSIADKNCSSVFFFFLSCCTSFGSST